MEDHEPPVPLPALPRVLVFIFWSALLHLALLLLLNEMLRHGSPERPVVLDVRLRGVAQPEPLLPDFITSDIRRLESSLSKLTTDVPAPAPGPVASALSSSMGPAGGDYYFRADELDGQPVPLADVKLVYPESAKTHEVDGYVKLLILIDETGKLRRIEVLEGSPPGVFDAAALAAFRDLAFEPGRVGGMPVKSRMVVRVDFGLTTESSSALQLPYQSTP